MIEFNIRDFPKFLIHWWGTDLPYQEQFSAHGFISCCEIYHKTRYSLSEDEYTWFVLKWS